MKYFYKKSVFLIFVFGFLSILTMGVYSFISGNGINEKEIKGLSSVWSLVLLNDELFNIFFFVTIIPFFTLFLLSLYMLLKFDVCLEFSEEYIYFGGAINKRIPLEDILGVYVKRIGLIGPFMIFFKTRPGYVRNFQTPNIVPFFVESA